MDLSINLGNYVTSKKEVIKTKFLRIKYNYGSYPFEVRMQKKEVSVF